MAAKECARCKTKECYEGKDCFGLSDEARSGYSEDALRSMRVSGEIEAEHYMKMCRLEEIMTYAKKMGMRKMGVAFCVGLSAEAELLDGILTSQGFEVHSACCKICGIDKADVGVPKMHGDDGGEAVCNPVGQALRLNQCKTDMNIVVGLCVGHDMLFTKRSEAPVTTFVVKDRVLAHNPVGAIYSGYYLEHRFGLSTE
jgi:uncharacterized metal-binding protein